MLNVCGIQLTVQQVSKNDRYHNVEAVNKVKL